MLGANSFADDNQPKCNPSGTQLEMKFCARDDYKKADKKLNDVWQQLMKKGKGNKSYIKKIRNAQRQWLKFRDAEVDAMFACDEGDNMRVCWGSIYPMLYHGALTHLTELRIKQLQDYLDHGRNVSVGN